MGLTLTLTDAELPASPAFIEFLHASLRAESYFAGSWYQQEDENLARDEERFEGIQDKAKEVVAHPQGKQWLLRSYRFFKELLTGDVTNLREIRRFQFFFIIGIPRTGGTYLTKQIFRAGAIDYKRVQNALAHDGFPHLARLSFKESGNIHTNGLLQLAEYLTMVEVFFSQYGKLAYRGGIVVPKKFTKAIYYFDLIRELFPDNAHYLITLRHPLAVCQSILDKSGGMPADGRFVVRSAIERWALNDWMHWGIEEEKVKEMEYVEVMLGYWKRFHFQMAMTGLPAMPTATIIPYGAEPMTRTIENLYKAFGVKLDPEAFKVAKPPRFGPEQEVAAERVMSEVNALWAGLGMDFPAKDLAGRL